jgi:hypothetical protein
MEWRDIPKYAKYQASTCGKIKNKKTGRILIPWETDKGYLKVTVYGRVDRFVHRLVYAAHEHEIPCGMCINHTNMDKKDNCIDNLECVTLADNNKHASVCRKILSTA